MPLTLGSLFDGIAGFPLAGYLNGIISVWASEINENCIEVSQHWFPEVKQYGDITKIDGHKLPSVDIITGGSPCQNLSIAGNMKGLAGEQSGLFRDMIRIIKEMREATNGQYPRYIIWENVPGAFSSNNGYDFYEVLKSFAGFWNQEDSIPIPESGHWKTKEDGAKVWCIDWARAGDITFEMDGVYTGSVAYRVLDAEYFGVPQRRHRIVLVADLRTDSARKILFECQSLSGNIEQGREERKEIASCLGEGFAGDSGKRQVACCDTAGEGKRQDAESVNLIPMIMKMREGQHGSGGRGPLVSDKSFTLSTLQEQTLFVPVYDMTHADSVIREYDGVTPTLQQRAGTGGNQVPMVVNALASKFGVKQQNYVFAVRTSEQTANGCGVQEDVSHTLGANDRDAICNGMAVRRLTPLECERLQGFPSGWTAVNNMSDSARYRMLGNSIAIPVFDWVFRRLVKYA